MGENIYYVGGRTPNKQFYYSTDLINWTAINGITTSRPCAITSAYGNNKKVAFLHRSGDGAGGPGGQMRIFNDITDSTSWQNINIGYVYSIGFIASCDNLKCIYYCTWKGDFYYIYYDSTAIASTKGTAWETTGAYKKLSLGYNTNQQRKSGNCMACTPNGNWILWWDGDDTQGGPFNMRKRGTTGYNGGTPTFSNISLSDIFRINIGDQLQTTWNPGYTSQGLRIGTTHILCGSFVGKIYTASLNSSCFTGTTIATRILKDDLNNWDDAFQWAFDNANSYIEIKEVYTISGWKICGCAMTADGQKMVIVESGEEGRAAYSFDAGSTWNFPKWWRWTTGGVGWESTQGTASNGASNSEKNRFVQTSDDGKYVFIGSLYAKITETTAGTWISNDYGENFYSYKDLTSNSEGIALSVAGASWNGSSSPFSDISTNNFLSIANIGGTDHANNIKSYPPTILLTPENVFTNNIQNNNEFRDAIILISKGFDPSDGTTALTTKADRRTKYKSQFKGRNKDHFGGTTLKEKLLTLKNSILAMIQDSFEDDDTDDSKFIEIDEFNGRAAGKLTAVLKPANAQDGTLEIAKEKAVYLPGTGKWRRNITKARIRIIEKDDETDKFRLILSDAPDENGYIDIANTKIIFGSAKANLTADERAIYGGNDGDGLTSDTPAKSPGDTVTFEDDGWTWDVTPGSADEIGTPPNNNGSSGGDPYINPIYGSKYKLPDRGDIYRFLDNNNLNNRFLINISCWNLPPQLKNELDNFLYNDIISRTNLGNKKEVDNWLLKQNIHIPQTAVFIRYLYINNNESIIFDLEKFQFINKHGESVENIPKVFILTNNLDIKSKLNIAAYDTIKPDKELQIITNTITYGKVTINLMKYNNPQIRNAYNILTEIPITSYNSRGALLGNQKISNILIDDLDNINKINKFVLKCNLNINELFIDKNGILKWEKF